MTRKQSKRPTGPKQKPQEPDFLDEVIESATKADPSFPFLLAAAEKRRAFMRKLAALRERAGLTQKQVADRMGTSQPAIARLEAQHDALESTFDSYAAAMGFEVVRTLRRVNAQKVSAAPAEQQRLHVPSPGADPGAMRRSDAPPRRMAARATGASSSRR